MRSRGGAFVACAAALSAIVGSSAAIAQSPFTTAKADGSIILDRGGFVQATFDDALFRLGYTLDRRDEQWQALMDSNPAARFHFGRRFGFEVQGKPGGNVASLLKANELVSGGRVALSFGVTDLLSFRPSKNEIQDAAQKREPPPAPRGNLIYDWLTIEAGVERSDVKLYDASRAFADQFSTEKFVGYSVDVHYNAEFGGRIPAVLGLSLGVRRTNNADELTEVSLVDRQTTTSPDGTTQRISERSRKGLSGGYEVSTPIALNTDLVLYPFLAGGMTGTPAQVQKAAKASVAFDIFTRSTFGSDRSFVPGVGAYVTAPGAPLKVYGGVTVFLDNDRQVGSNIVAGFAF